MNHSWISGALILLLVALAYVNLNFSKDCEESYKKQMTTHSSSSTTPQPLPQLKYRYDTSGDEVMNNSENATVMGMATGYDVGVFKRFVGSLRNSGYKGHIILVIGDNMDPEAVNYLSSKGVLLKTLQLVPCTTVTNMSNYMHDEIGQCAHPYPYLKIRWGRFPLLRDFLQECETCTGPVLVTDVRDVFFQRDPFGDGAPMVKGLQVFQEFKLQKTTHKLVKDPVSLCKGVVFDEIMLCSGTTIGTREAMLAYLEVMRQEMEEWTKDPNCCCNNMVGDDQSIHNYLYYMGRFPNATSVPNRYGIVNTVGVQAAEIFKKFDFKEDENPWIPPTLFDLVDNDGFFTDYDGSRSRVVHQWDRFKHMIEPWLSTSGLVDP